MRYLSMAAIGCGLLLPNLASAACSDYFKFEPDARLSVQAISKLGEVQASPEETARGERLVLQSFDREDRPVRGDWAALAIVSALDGGLGVRPAAGVLWARKDLDLYTGGDRPSFSKSGGDIVLTLSLPAIIRICKRPYSFRLDGQGNLFADGAHAGRVR